MKRFREQLEKVKLRQLLEEPYHFVRLYFILLFFQSLFIMAPKMQVHLNQLFILWGSLILLYSLLFRREKLKNTTILLLGASWMLALVTIVINREAGSLGYSLKTWYLLALVFGIFFPFFILTQKKKEEAFRGIALPLLLLQFATALISLTLFFQNVSGYILRPDSNFYWGLRYNFRQSGSINPLLIGLYNEPNYGAIIILSSILFSFLLLQKKENSKGLKVFLWSNIAIESYFLILTNSRSAYLALGLILSVLFFLFAKDKVYLRVKPKWLTLHVLLFIMLSLVTLFAGGIIRELSYKFIIGKEVTRVTIFLPNSVSKEDLPKEEMKADKLNILKVKGFLSDSFLGKNTYFLVESREDLVEDSEIMKRLSADKEDTVSGLEGKGNGRIGRWKEAFSMVAKHKPFTGTTPRGAAYFAQKYGKNEEEYWRLKAGYSPVNSYLTYLLYYGFPVFLLLIFAYLRGGLISVVGILTAKNLKPEQVFMAALLLFMFVEAMFLSALVEVCTYYSCMLALSFSYNLSEYDKEKGNEGSLHETLN